MELECFRMQDPAPEIVPGRPDRAWMDSFQSRFPYRCLPLTMANTTGWEILCPVDFMAEWNGGPRNEDLKLTPLDPNDSLGHFVQSHFTHGILTMHTGYLFRTPPGWAVWCSGAPNHVKDGVQALEGLIETDWLPFPFTMNWIMTRPGRVYFNKGEPFCFINLIEHQKMDAVQPVLKYLDADPELLKQYQVWTEKRTEFNAKLEERDPETMKQAWQRFYFKGEIPVEDADAPAEHMVRRRLKSAIEAPRPNLGKKR